MKKLFDRSVIVPTIIFTSILLLIGLSGCNGCKYASTYSVNSGTKRGSMIYGHDNHEIVISKFSKTPYSNKVKPKKQTNSNPNAHHWWS